MRVSYLRVPLAGGHLRAAAPMEQRDEEVVARGRGVAVPGYLLDSLADDVRSGRAVFEVTLMSPHGGGGRWRVLRCWAKVVADEAALEHRCRVSYVDADLPVPRPGQLAGPAVIAEKAAYQ
ncbi:hypothetical protein ACP4OV_010243 [Aristida adscensionis]